MSDSGSVMQAPAARCDFCDEFTDGFQNTFNQIYGSDPKTRVLFRSDDFAVVPSLGQIAEGHLLLLPIKHWTATGDLTEDLLKELTRLSEAVITILRREYGSCITFEHGVRSGSAGGCGISHAHLHVLPLPSSLDPIGSLKAKFPHKRVGDLNEVRKQSKGMVGYLFYEDSHSRAYLFDTPKLESQYMRKTLTAILDMHDWDWRTAGREERLLATVNRLSGHFDNICFSAATRCK
jgi:diadenosine tetraphosphate (Ap4A) HIT family hydrolase